MEFKLTSFIFIPIALFAVSAGVLFWNYHTTGDFILKDVDLKGGTLITINTEAPIDVVGLEHRMDGRFGSAFVSGLKTSTGYGATVQVESGTRAGDVIEVAEDFGIEVVDFSEETVGPALGSLFFEQVRVILIAAFVLMSFVIFLIYRNPIASFGIVFSIIANTITTLAMTSLLGISLSFAGFAAILMMIGFTVDTNIVLTSKMAAGGTESFMQRYKKSMKTGVLITATIASTMALLLFLSTSKLLINIAQVLVIGLLADLLFTWIFNAALLEAHFKRSHGHSGGSA